MGPPIASVNTPVSTGSRLVPVTVSVSNTAAGSGEMLVIVGLRPRISTEVVPRALEVQAVTVSGDWVALAVYSPEEVTPPYVACQFTCVCGAPSIVAVNCCVLPEESCGFVGEITMIADKVMSAPTPMLG